MGKRFNLVLVVACVGLFGLLAALLLRSQEQEPEFRGKRLTYWANGYVNGLYAANQAPLPTRDDADLAVRSLGTKALPTLLTWLREPDRPLLDKFYAFVEKQKLIHINLPARETYRKNFGLWGLIALGPAASNAVPQLIDIYNHPPNFLSRQMVPIVLAGIGPPAKAAIPILIRGTTNSDLNVRFNSIYALGQIHSEPELVMPVLIKLLHDPSPELRAFAARAMGLFGANARVAVPDLLQIISDKKLNASFSFPVTGLWDWSVADQGGFGFTVSNANSVGNYVADALIAIDPEAATHAGIELPDAPRVLRSDTR